jgi:uncharacterized membrane protein
MKLTGLTVVSILLIVGTFLVGIWAYPQMPEQVASHWNLQNEVDGHLGKFWGTFLFPLVMIGAFLLLRFIPLLDPRIKNIDKFRGYFEIFTTLLLSFFLYLYLLMIGWNLGTKLPLNQLIPPALGVLIFYIGVLMAHAEPNWTIGVRTPWTLSNDKVWEKTHRLAGTLFKIVGVVTVGSAFLPGQSFFIFIGAVAFVSIFLLFYSLYLYKTIDR